VECIGKGKARKPYEFGVKVGIAVTHKQGLIVGARAYPGNPYDGHILREQLEQVSVLLEDVGVKPKQVVVDLGFRGVDGENPGVEIIHRGKAKRLSLRQRRWLKRRSAGGLPEKGCAPISNWKRITASAKLSVATVRTLLLFCAPCRSGALYSSVSTGHG
jgi:hypothetical protein